MMIRLLMTGLLLISGMKGVQACIGKDGHFHWEIVHSHADHCDGHSHPVDQPSSPHSDHSDNHSHVDLAITDPLNHCPHRLALKKIEPRLIAILPSICDHTLSAFEQTALLPCEVPRFRAAASFRKAQLSTIVLRL